jgi:methylenetetrahydrofolate--tRNA-(uracil-5-)-methyltransferase
MSLANIHSAKTVIVGGGLAGCECALVLARFGLNVVLCEQKPGRRSPAHTSPLLAELVCSNSLRSDERVSGIGLLKAEMRALGSAFMRAADDNRVPADKALAVDREAFAAALTARVRGNSRIQVLEHCVASLNDPALDDTGAIVIAAGPLASEDLSASLALAAGSEHCYFYDAIAPIVWTDSLDRSVVFRGSRYDAERGAPAGTDRGDYLNCPMSREEYERFYDALRTARRTQVRDFEQVRHFEGCMPLEALADRGPRTLTFGPLKPVGFTDPRTGRRPWAVLQLRAENLNMQACNLVGCQTRLVQSEQARVFRLVPGLEKAEFIRYGSMHRNTYVNAPLVLAEDLSLKRRPDVFLAGQICGVEGYVESAASGLWLGLLLAARACGRKIAPPPPQCALGALLEHLRRPARYFQPSNAHFGLMPELEEKTTKKNRREIYADRAEAAFALWLAGLKDILMLPSHR